MNFQSELKKIDGRSNQFYAKSIDIIKDKFYLRNNV